MFVLNDSRLEKHIWGSTTLRFGLQTSGAAFYLPLEGNRTERFEKIDRPALRPLPTQTYSFAEWKKARVHIDYHVEIEGHYYSVPYALVHREMDVR